jgi:hypothetical protein
MPLYKFKNKISGDTLNLILSVEEYYDFKNKNPNFTRILTAPKLKWNATGGASNSGIGDASHLRERLVKGMKNEEIDDLIETQSGEAVVNQYINEQHHRGKIIASETNNLFTRELPNGDVCTDYIVDVAEKTGKITKV